MSDIEAALSQRDEILRHLTGFLQSFTEQVAPDHDLMSQVQTLAKHICTLQAQLIQVRFFLRLLFVLLSQSVTMSQGIHQCHCHSNMADTSININIARRQ